jgi:predicted RecB family nuclease
MTNIEHSKSTITPECYSAAECSGCKATIEQSESRWHIGSEQQEQDHEAAQTIRERITKSDWLAAQGCTSQAWFALRSKRTVPNEAGLFRMEQGREIGTLARELFPGGTIVSELDVKKAAQVTAELLNAPSTVTLFEAAFVADKFVARADVLKREQNGWHVLEVKSSFPDTNGIKDLIDDLAYTVFVLRRSGLSVRKASLVLLSRGFRYGDGPDHLFEILDKTIEVDLRVTDLEGSVDTIVGALFADERPSPVLLSGCRDCKFFETDCLGVGVDHTVLEIPGLHNTKLKRLSAAGIIDLSELPNDLNLNDCQVRARAAAISGKVFIKTGLSAALHAIQWPCHYLDFETMATVLPAYQGHGCHRQVLTQFSIHSKDRLSDEPSHRDYLADAAQACERILAEALIRDLGDSGSIMVYSPFEKTCISGLRNVFPDLAPALQQILDRLIDILLIIRDHVSHQGFRGSFSIKKVLPALVPALSYKDLEVADGDTAIVRFARMARGEITGENIETTRQHLLKYCKLDTFAMVRLHEQLSLLAAIQAIDRAPWQPDPVFFPRSSPKSDQLPRTQ